MNIDVSTSGGIRRLVLNRPDRRNAWSAECGSEMLDALHAVRADPTVRCVVITGAGQSFCAGVDLQDGFDYGPDGVPDLRGMHRRTFAPVILEVRTLPVPVVTAVNGPAVGFGAALAVAGDFTLMAESAFLLLAFARLGLSPDGGTTLMLPSRVGRQRAIELAMLAEPLPAATALEWGLVHDVAPDAELPARVDALAERLAAGPTRAYAVIKDLFNAQERPGLAEHLELEGNLIQSLAGTEDFQEGVAAFTERRPAAFRGR